MSLDLQLNGLRTVVTGGTMGLGAAVVKDLVEGGVQVATSARDVSVTQVNGVTYIGANLTSAQGVAQLAQTVVELERCRYRDQRGRRLKHFWRWVHGKWPPKYNPFRDGFVRSSQAFCRP
ncbi:hypothetical protein [Pseudomonas sp. NPDC096950]|uniref:hypothetical protein n=1 Tax=Pseudomonas sp. NPDC096950 TaxID=3364485 RepID=UPI00383BC899